MCCQRMVVFAKCLCTKHFIYGEVKAATDACSCPSMFLSTIKIKTVFTIIKTFLSMHSINETRVVLARICSPYNR
ncbi:unnamed protein product [Coffea canephora]|uniref:Uncharacterized protein n=1 Tax=Coffea canephora TaxID=49390 RepID=A0A068U0G9_COFCA|nr:unnamed protein product [Coffea canephora]